MAQWAWEFLRRSDDYREQWAKPSHPSSRRTAGLTKLRGTEP